MEKPIGIILAAGRGTRMRELTSHIPKPLLEVRGEPLLAHVLRGIAPQVSQVVIVVGYLGEQIRDFVGSSYEGVPVTYAVQQNPTGGTLDALRVGMSPVKMEQVPGFIAVSADDIHQMSAFERLGKQAKEKPEDMMLVGARLEDKEKIRRFGVFVFNEEGKIVGIEEKPAVPPSQSINCALYYFPMKFKEVLYGDISPAQNGELFLTDAVDAWIHTVGADYFETDVWEPIGTPEDIAHANRIA